MIMLMNMIVMIETIPNLIVVSKNRVVGVGSNPVLKVATIVGVMRVAPTTMASLGQSSAPRAELVQNSSRLPPDSCTCGAGVKSSGQQKSREVLLPKLFREISELLGMSDAVPGLSGGKEKYPVFLTRNLTAARSSV